MAKTVAEKRAILEAELDELKKKEKQELRAIENRKKMLIGNFVYGVMKKDGIGAALLTYNSKSFDEWLKSQSDRELFGLKSVEKKMATFEENLAKAKSRGRVAADKKAPDKPQQLNLELWPDAVRGVPNAILRSALFGVSKERQIHKTRTMVAAVDGYDIRFKGEMFNQTDLDLWEMLLHLARLQPLGTEVEFTAHSLLKALGRGTGGKDHEDLKEQLMRLIGGAVEITWTKQQKAFAGALVSGYFRDDETGRYVVKFNKDMAKLYGMGYTNIDWEERQALGQDLLAKWLHGHYASHAAAYPYKVETLKTWSRSTTKRLSDFRTALRAALDKLAALGAIKSWKIDPVTDLVSVVTVPSKSQIKHLTKSKKREI